MKRRTWLRLTRKLRKTFNPVDLGQTRGGLILVAVLIAGWQLSAPVRAEIVSGSSSNEYFRLEWSYDMDAGTGLMALERGEHWWSYLILTNASFVTAGTPFEEIKWNSYDVFDTPTYIGEEAGLPLYEYETLAPIHVPNEHQFPFDVNIRFNTENAEIRATEFCFEGYMMSSFGGVGFPIPSTPLPFVTIQTIPEPAAAATVILAATALAAASRRRDRE